jgi:hypothetical protein
MTLHKAVPLKACVPLRSIVSINRNASSVPAIDQNPYAADEPFPATLVHAGRNS